MLLIFNFSAEDARASDATSGQIAMIQNYAGWYYRQFYDVIAERFGEPRQFVRIGTSDGEKNYSAEWAKRNIVALGWSELGDLSEYVNGNGIDRKEIQDKLKDLFYPNDNVTSSRKAGEIVRYYNCDKNTVFVVMDGQCNTSLKDG